MKYASRASLSGLSIILHLLGFERQTDVILADRDNDGTGGREYNLRAAARIRIGSEDPI